MVVKNLVFRYIYNTVESLQPSVPSQEQRQLLENTHSQAGLLAEVIDKNGPQISKSLHDRLETYPSFLSPIDRPIGPGYRNQIFRRHTTSVTQPDGSLK